MLRMIQQKLGTAGFLISIVALVAALGGGAYAASGGLTGKQKKEVTKIAQTEAKKFAGKQGAPGTTGPQGPAGPAGAKGDNGANGSDGKEGPQGKQGEPGKPGKEGSPWTAGGTLPAEKTETGAWAIGREPEGFIATPVYTAISFSIPLVAGLSEANVHYIKEGETPPTECAGGTAEKPAAEPGQLCVFAGQESPFMVFRAIQRPGLPGELKGAGPTGASLKFTGEEEGSAWGSWAVTGEIE
jgi:hypothetical protein